jgi:hypothetical protein
MSSFLKIDDLAANALIELIKNNRESKVSLSQLEAYGTAIVSLLHDDGKDAAMAISQYTIDQFLNLYADFFTLQEEENDSYVYLKKDKSITDLRRSFRAYVPLEILPVFSNEKSVESLLG